jgi:hypothetical protein
MLDDTTIKWIVIPNIHQKTTTSTGSLPWQTLEFAKFQEMTKNVLGIFKSGIYLEFYEYQK